MNDDKNVGQVIHNKRKELSLTQEDLAEKVHVTRQAVSNWERNKTVPDDSMIDQLRYIEETVEKQKIISNDNTQRDIFNFYVDRSWISIQVFFLRQAKLLRRETKMFPLTDTEDPEDEFTSFIVQFYGQRNRILPKEVLVPDGINNEALSEVIKVPVRTPKRGQKRSLLNMAKDNAKLKIDDKFRLLELGNRKTKGAQKEIFDALGLPYGHVIESFDHSHIQGADRSGFCNTLSGCSLTSLIAHGLFLNLIFNSS